jgi:hypothetical protein
VLADNARPEHPLDLLVNQIPNFKGAVPPAGEFY